MRTDVGDLRIKVSVDPDGRQLIYDGQYSDVREVQDTTLSRIVSGEWECYQIAVEKWEINAYEQIAYLGGSVHESGLSGLYWSPDGFSDEGTREVVRTVWQEALDKLRHQ